MYFYKKKKKKREVKSSKHGVITTKDTRADLQVALDELCCFDCSLYIKADVHFHLRFVVGEFNNWHLMTEMYRVQ